MKKANNYNVEKNHFESNQDDPENIDFENLKEHENELEINSNIEKLSTIHGKIALDLNNLNINEGQPIFLIKKMNNSFALCDEAFHELSKFDSKISLITIIGEKKSGKSLLCNNLLNLKEGKGIQNNLENSDGIVIWNTPLYIKEDNCLLFFCECVNSSKNDNLNLISYLISSTFIYNNDGDNFEKNIQNLQFLDLLDKKTNFFNSNLSLPNLIWISRNIDDKSILNNGGNLNRSLFLKLLIGLKSEKQNFTQKIIEIFNTKDIFYLPTPPKQILNRSKIESKNDSQFESSNFTKYVSGLKQYILDKSKTKSIFEINLNARMFLTFCNMMIESLNYNEQIDLNHCWNTIVENECIVAYNECLDLYNELLKKFFGDDKPKKNNEIIFILKNLRDMTLEKYTIIAGIKENNNFYNEYQNKLKEILNQKEKKLIEINNSMNSEKSEEFLKDMIDKIKEKLRNNKNNPKFYQELIKELNQYMNKYQNLFTDINLNNFIKNSIFINEEISFAFQKTIKEYEEGPKGKNETHEIKLELEKTRKEKLEEEKNRKEMETILKKKEEVIKSMEMQLKSHEANKKKKKSRWFCM